MRDNFLKAFTLIELLIVIAIIAILAVTIVPNFIGFDSEAKIAATKTNLETLRTRVMLYRAKEGKYPGSLSDLVTKFYYDAGVKKPYLKSLPLELISSKAGSSEYEDTTTDTALPNDGGWVYFTDTAEIIIDIETPLDRTWGDSEGEIPSKW